MFGLEPPPSAQEREQEEDKEDNEAHFRDRGRRSGYYTETKDARENGYDKEDKSVA
jgi:hypothetical protein